MENKILDFFYHYLGKGKVSLTTYKYIIQALEKIEQNEIENSKIFNAIDVEMKGMEMREFNNFKPIV